MDVSRATFYVLLALADGERNGAAIARDAARLSDGSVRIPPGTLYRLVKQLQADRWIVEVGLDDEDDRRRFYRLTARGRQVAQAEARRMEVLVRAARERRLLSAGSSA